MQTAIQKKMGPEYQVNHIEEAPGAVNQTQSMVSRSETNSRRTYMSSIIRRDYLNEEFGTLNKKDENEEPADEPSLLSNSRNPSSNHHRSFAEMLTDLHKVKKTKVSKEEKLLRLQSREERYWRSFIIGLAVTLLFSVAWSVTWYIFWNPHFKNAKGQE